MTCGLRKLALRWIHQPEEGQKSTGNLNVLCKVSPPSWSHRCRRSIWCRLIIWLLAWFMIGTALWRNNPGWLAYASNVRIVDLLEMIVIVTVRLCQHNVCNERSLIQIELNVFSSTGISIISKTLQRLVSTTYVVITTQHQSWIMLPEVVCGASPLCAYCTVFDVSFVLARGCQSPVTTHQCQTVQCCIVALALLK